MHQSRFLFALVTYSLLATPLAAAPLETWLKTTDGVAVRGDLYTAPDDDAKAKPFILLFHQAGSNRGEYATIGPRLNAMGFHALAIDQRSGDDLWGVKNETVPKLGESREYLEAVISTPQPRILRKACGPFQLQRTERTNQFEPLEAPAWAREW